MKRHNIGQKVKTHFASINRYEKLSTSANTVCLQCLEKKAVLLKTAQLQKKIRVFCSAECAAAFALHNVFNSRIRWCIEHKGWSAESGRCFLCCPRENGQELLKFE